MIDLKDYNWWKTLIEYFLLIYAFFSTIVPPAVFYFEEKTEGIRMIWKAVKSSRRYGQSFLYFLFFSGFSSLLYCIMSFLSLERGYLVIILVLTFCLSILIPAVEEGLKANDLKFEKEQSIRFKIKESHLEESAYHLTEAAACLLHPDRYWHIDSWTVQNASIYLYSAPDFIYEALGISKDGRLSDRNYYTREERLTGTRLLNNQTVLSRRYRPSEEEVRSSFPALLKIVENSLKPYVEPLSYPIKTLNDQYTNHICKLIELLEDKEFDKMDIERKVYNQLNQPIK